jgi:hypothetical protein
MNLTPFAFGREYNYPFKVCKQTLVLLEISLDDFLEALH